MPYLSRYLPRCVALTFAPHPLRTQAQRQREEQLRSSQVLVAAQATTIAERDMQLVACATAHAAEKAALGAQEAALRAQVEKLNDSRSTLAAEHAAETAALRAQVAKLSDSRTALVAEYHTKLAELKSQLAKASDSHTTLVAGYATELTELKSQLVLSDEEKHRMNQKLSDSCSALVAEHVFKAVAETETRLEQSKLKAVAETETQLEQSKLKAQLSKASSDLWEEKATAAVKRATGAEEALTAANKALKACAKGLADAKEALKTQASTSQRVWKVRAEGCDCNLRISMVQSRHTRRLVLCVYCKTQF